MEYFDIIATINRNKILMIPVDFTASRSSYLWEATLKGEGMRQEKSFRSEAAVITTGLAMGESPRWHDRKLWVSDWGAQEILAIDSLGRRQALGRCVKMTSFAGYCAPTVHQNFAPIP